MSGNESAGINFNDTGVLSLLGNIANGGYRNRGNEAYADMAGLMHALKNNQQSGENQADCTRNFLEALMSELRTVLESNERGRSFDRVIDGQRDIDKAIQNLAQNAMVQFKDIQLEILRDGGMTREKIGNEARVACERDLQHHAQVMAELATIKCKQESTDTIIVTTAEKTALQQEVLSLRGQLDQCKNPPRVHCVDPCCP